MDTQDLRSLLSSIADYASRRREEDATRPARPAANYEDMLARFRLPLGEDGVPAEQVIRELIANAEPGLMTMTGPRFHGWVIGASNPVGVAADWLTSIWGQNNANHVATPAASAAEEAAANALLDLLDLPRTSSVGFVTGATMANFTCLAAARSEMLRREGWDVEAQGLFGAPPITVLIGEEAHSTVFSALKYVGFGAERVTRIPIDRNGAMLPDPFRAALAKTSGPVIAIAQAGQINTGAIDPFESVSAATREKKAWLHVDGAFGLWARAAPDRAHLAKGIDDADSWAVDGHKWLQTPYDCGYAIVRDAAAHKRSMQIPASYLPGDEGRNPADYVPELSRRARGFATWAMIRHLGRRRIGEMVSRHCALARRFAEKLSAEPGVEIVNDVTLNQLAVRFGDDAQTRAVIARVQSDGVTFVGGADWRGRWIMRISVISEGTTEADVDTSAAAMIGAWRKVKG